jgi:hypothetical protein
MGTKHGWNMLTAKPEMLEMFGKWNFSKNAVIVKWGTNIISIDFNFVSQNFCVGKFFNGSRNITYYMFAIIE